MTFKSSQVEHLKLVTEFIGKSCCKHTIAGPGEMVRYETWTRTELLGEGGFGAVYQETCSETRAVRAVKQIRKSLALRWDEVGILEQLRSNPEHFVQLIGWFEDEFDIYLAMEFLPGDLGGLLEEQTGGLSENESKSVTKQILTGLEVLHKKSICHRDLKPGNILISKWAPLRVKIGDFGVSKLKHPDSNTEWRTTAGTRPFMAPEIQDLSHGQESSVYTTAVDIWSLGCLVYFMLTNTLPFPQTRDLKNYIRNRSLFPPRTAAAPTIPESAVGFLASLLQHVPENRPPASQALLHSWLSIQEQTDETTWTSIFSEASKLVPVPGPNKKAGTASEAAPAAEGKSATKDRPGQKNHRVPITTRRRSKIPYILYRYLTVSGVQELTEVTDAVQYLLVAAAASGDCEMLVQQLGKGAEPMEDPSGYTPIYVAAENGHLSIIKLLLEHGANLGVGGTHRVSALHGATSTGALQIAQYLLDRGADISAMDSMGRMAHHMVAQAGATEVLQLLVENGADISALGGKRKGTALMFAAWRGRLDTVRYLLDRGADISATDTEGCMAHHIAAENGATEVLQLLVEKGADISALGGKRKRTALMYAACKGRLDAARYLLDRGADISATAKEGRMAHHIAAKSGATEVLQLLVERGADISASGGTWKWTALMFAACKGRLDAARYLLDRGADILATGSKGCMAHHIATESGATEVLQLLVERGADISASGGTGTWTALMFAACKGRLDAARYLLDRGADISATDNKGRMAHQIAAEYGATEVLQLLLERGADISASGGTWKWTALMFAACKGRLDAARDLLDRGAGTLATDNKGRMAHHIAARYGATEVLQLLVEKGADISALGAERKWTALMFAAMHGHLDSTRYLLDRGADISVTDNEGRMAHHIAAEYGATEVLQLLVEKGADISALGVERKWTALMFAAMHGHLDSTRYLLDRGADVSEEALDSKLGALKLAAGRGHIDIVRLLLDRGAYTSVTTAVEEAKSEAASQGHAGIVTLITEWFENKMSIPSTDLGNLQLN